MPDFTDSPRGNPNEANKVNSLKEPEKEGAPRTQFTAGNLETQLGN